MVLWERPSRPVTNVVIDAMVAAVWYQRAVTRARWAWLRPWTIRRRREQVRLWYRHASSSLDRVRRAVGEADQEAPGLSAEGIDREEGAAGGTASAP
ncbi:hypothetical protein GCM10023170_010660 [Phytohabitans houttuyneae]|uniref:Uncharacterized protein n=1 Tax=Phytohabitans houttuyneae TaxID=1076126 RepID=A0A6V8KBU7_9ACTN|nr:hypothetical protein Phou_036360 [Phytohabitans houttuyneae]